MKTKYMTKDFDSEADDQSSLIEYTIVKNPKRFLSFSSDPVPKGFRGVVAGKGEMILKCDDNRDVYSYQFEYKLVDADKWETKTVARPRSKVILTGLRSGHEYIFRVIYIGNRNIAWEYSEEIRSFILPLRPDK